MRCGTGSSSDEYQQKDLCNARESPWTYCWLNLAGCCLCLQSNKRKAKSMDILCVLYFNIVMSCGIAVLIQWAFTGTGEADT